MTYLALYDLIGTSTNYSSLPSTTNISNQPTTSNVGSLLQFTIPDGKLFYPEPFIASPSYLHSDLTYLHLFQYWYWLWFMFIFLICFFFISFVCTVRWCTNRVRPRRETRGVSRSKCGDLITACVPVTWAMSIIVNESTDAIDLNDGFGTAELVVGVRAYQWGWEYYYPRSIDLNYNVRPSYSTFIGNSLSYKFSSSKNLSTNMLWRAYQNKLEDRVITPAHLILLPNEEGSSFNFLNFQNIGVNTLQESSAFSKIRNATKVYNTHLVHTPNSLSNKYNLLTSLYEDDSSFHTSSSFGVYKQHNLLSVSSLGNSLAGSTLDSTSFNKYLSTNFSANTNLDLSASSNSLSSPDALSLSKPVSKSGITETPRIANVLGSSAESGVNTKNLPLNTHPSWESNFNDNSDQKGLQYPISKVATSSLTSAQLTSANSAYSQLNSQDSLSATDQLINTNRSNLSTNARVLNISGPNSKVLAGDQSVRVLPELSGSKSNFNLSSGVNTLESNSTVSSRLNSPNSPFTSAIDYNAGFPDKTLVSKLENARSLNVDGLPPVLSSDPSNSNSLEYDSLISSNQTTSFLPDGTLATSKFTKSAPVGEVFVGSREKTPRAINTSYWTTFWANTTPNHRVNGSLATSLNQTHFYLPTFYLYSDYDFRNDQAIEMLDELFWESSYSAYNFDDYLNLSINSSSDINISAKEKALSSQFSLGTMGKEGTLLPLTVKPSKDLSAIGDFYSNSIQMEDSVARPNTTTLSDFATLPVFADLNDIDESYTNFKGLSALLSRFASTPLGVSSASLAPRSYLSVLNHFRSDYSDFNWYTLSPDVNDSKLSVLGDIETANAHLLDLDSELSFDSTTFGDDLRLSNPAVLRSSARNSIVNYNAFQKVFKPRLDESRAHVNTSTLSDLRLSQPFINDVKVPYTQMLGKNRDSFYSTPLYKTSSKLNFNPQSSLIDAINTPMYDFPFLLARTSDTMRFTWVDWFSSWKHIEVQPSSVSRYSTLGVPYLRKPFDFNSNTGDKFQDTELYFTRVARSRRNYLTNWSYSPYMYNRAYLWNNASLLDSLFLDLKSSASSSKASCVAMGWYWSSAQFSDNGYTALNFSSSGNDVYGKSTWRPNASIALYYYNVSKLIDILSKREFLYRLYLENSSSQVSLPKTLCAAPTNPLLKEVKSSFLFSDPATYSSEYSRDLLYSSAPYFKFMLLQNTVNTLSSSLSSAPINAKLLTDYLFFYFFGANTSSLGKNSDLLKSQFRPLKKGISSMLRLHATGAVAMPIEIRLQVLASSRDVIHSWAIPSASIKIDCVPGYTSHRMMKFLLTGVYWGQCQEICGRYHHWMPIVVYFMKRDLFFLWCTHFVFAPSPNSTWEISDRRFADLIRFASYDKSSWLTEFGLSN